MSQDVLVGCRALTSIHCSGPFVEGNLVVHAVLLVGVDGLLGCRRQVEENRAHNNVLVIESCEEDVSCKVSEVGVSLLKQVLHLSEGLEDTQELWSSLELIPGAQALKIKGVELLLFKQIQINSGDSEILVVVNNTLSVDVISVIKDSV